MRCVPRIAHVCLIGRLCVEALAPECVIAKRTGGIDELRPVGARLRAIPELRQLKACRNRARARSHKVSYASFHRCIAFADLRTATQVSA